MLKVSGIVLLAIAIVLAFNGGAVGETDRTFLFGVFIAFMLGYGVRAIISWRHRREERRMLEAHERLMRVRPPEIKSISRTE